MKSTQSYTAGFIIARMIAAVLLVWALEKHPYGYYTLLRFVVCGVTAFGIYVAAEFANVGWIWIFSITAGLFNPIIPILLDRGTWAIIDVAVAGLLLASIRAYGVRSCNHTLSSAPFIHLLNVV